MLVNIHKHMLFLLFGVISSVSFAQGYTLQQCIDSALINNKKIVIAKNQQHSSEIKQVKRKQILSQSSQ